MNRLNDHTSVTEFPSRILMIDNERPVCSHPPHSRCDRSTTIGTPRGLTPDTPCKGGQTRGSFVHRKFSLQHNTPTRHASTDYAVGCSSGRLKRVSLLIPIFLVSWLGFASNVAVAAQEPQRVRGNDAGLARFVPQSASIFVTAHRLDEIDTALRRAHLLRLIPMLGGFASGSPVDIAATARRFLGLGTTGPTALLLRSEVGLIAPASLGVTESVWLFRLPPKVRVDHLFPRIRRLSSGGELVTMYRTTTGVTLCVRDGVVAAARRWGPGTLYDETVRLMRTETKSSLATSKEYRALLAHLPDKPLAVASLLVEPKLEGKLSGWSGWIPPIDRAIIGLYEGQGRLDLVVRASLATPTKVPKLAATAVKRLLELPRTTLYASGTTVQMPSSIEAAAMQSQSGTLSRYLALLAAIQQFSGDAPQEPVALGPHVLVAWGQDLRENTTTPQLALLIECHDAQGGRARARHMAQSIIGVLRTIDTADVRESISIQETRHLGVPIEYVKLARYSRESGLSLAPLTAHIEPAWTVWNEWLIVALSRDHLERILDAQFGLSSTLADVRDVVAMRSRNEAVAALTLVQPRLAADILGGWLSALESGQASLLDAGMWPIGLTQPVENSKTFKLEPSAQAGSLAVTQVGTESPVSGILQLHDRIIGVDGRLLPLTVTVDEFWRQLEGGAASVPARLRLRRGEEVLEVTVRRDLHAVGSSSLGFNPADALRELGSLGRALQFASYSVNVTDPLHFSARLSLRFFVAPDAFRPPQR